jgi:hypothetical protein
LSEEKGFLSRWSDRKLNPDSEQSEVALPDPPAEKAPEDEFEDKSDEEILSILELPEPETLKLGDTVEKFMDGRVPERIRARALRAFWKTNPVLANIDGLDEYCEDYTDAATVVENLQTIYQVGKGYAIQALDALESLAEDEIETEAIESVDKSIANREPQKLEVTDSQDSHSESATSESESVGTESPEDKTDPEQPASVDEVANVESIVQRPRRMQFQ